MPRINFVLYFFIANGTRLRAVENAPALRRIIFRFPVSCIFRRFLCVFSAVICSFSPCSLHKKGKNHAENRIFTPENTQQNRIFAPFSSKNSVFLRIFPLRNCFGAQDTLFLTVHVIISRNRKDCQAFFSRDIPFFKKSEKSAEKEFSKER